MPLALLLIWAIIGSFRLLPLPFICTVLIVSFSFATMSIVPQLASASALVVGLVAVVCLALGMDYYLFLISRYKEEMLITQVSGRDAIVD